MCICIGDALLARHKHYATFVDFADPLQPLRDHIVIVPRAGRTERRTLDAVHCGNFAMSGIAQTELSWVRKACSGEEASSPSHDVFKHAPLGPYPARFRETDSFGYH